MKSRKIYLAPGFFGFEAIGSLNYFHKVDEALGAALARRGFEAEIVECPTQPTGSIPRRAARLLEHIVETGGLEADEVHFVGHSTGGLDIRLLLSPGVRIHKDGLDAEVAKRTYTATTLATPNHGTPLASFFTTVQGKRILLLLAALASTDAGRAAILFSAKFASWVARMDDYIGRTDTMLDALSERLLRRMTLKKDDPILEFIQDIASDQGAILQLTPESMHLFNAAVVDRDSVDYACITTAAPPPPGAYELRDLLFNPKRSVMAFVFTVLHRLAAREHDHYPYPVPERERHRALTHYAFPIDTRSNDGIVPTLSQLHGRLVHAATADHLDVTGQFWRPDDKLSDWLPSGAGFRQEQFDALWDAVATVIVGA